MNKKEKKIAKRVIKEITEQIIDDLFPSEGKYRDGVLDAVVTIYKVQKKHEEGDR